jgi:hypothetical protein
MSTLREAFDSIAYCRNVELCRHGDGSHPCSKIVQSQHVSDKNFQVPEPWRGQIDKARILFIGSNPSIGNDRYALQCSPETQVWESQQLAFGGGSRPYVIDGIRTTTATGSPDRVVRYWSSIRARARELIPGAVPGQDYAISEIVHCKSKGEEGVAEAAQTCYAMHTCRPCFRGCEGRNRAREVRQGTAVRGRNRSFSSVTAGAGGPETDGALPTASQRSRRKEPLVSALDETTTPS